MSDAQGIRVMIRAVLFAILAFFIVPAKGVSEPHKKGRFTAVFEECSPLSETKAISRRMLIYLERISPHKKHNYDIEQESFEVYVPDSYDSNTPFGLMVWISPSPDGGLKHYPGGQQLMDKHKLIWVGANNSGNKTSPYHRRIPLALDAAYNMQKLYNIDPNRVYVAGLSGGGRVASITAFHHSDVYNGGIFIIGASYWEHMRVPGKNSIWRAACMKPRPKFLMRARRFGRYVLLTGDNDGNRLEMHTYYKKGYSRFLNNVLYIQVPGMGHEPPPTEEFDKALEYVDKPLSQQAVQATKKKHRSRGQKR